MKAATYEAKLCPILAAGMAPKSSMADKQLSSRCRGKECMWFGELTGRCAIMAIAIELSRVQTELKLAGRAPT